jgi:hypothetical protein
MKLECRQSSTKEPGQERLKKRSRPGSFICPLSDECETEQMKDNAGFMAA